MKGPEQDTEAIGRELELWQGHVTGTENTEAGVEQQALKNALTNESLI